ncbi:MAG: dockerin type I domain-containing protein [Tepidisphaeraceae bacterium]
MNRKTISLFAAVTFAASPLAFGQAYTFSILYPLTGPDGYNYTFIHQFPGMSQPIVAGQTVGYGSAGSSEHALLWSSPAGSAVDLNPSGFNGSYAYATSGTQQVGEAFNTTITESYNAMLWSGTAASAVNLNPSGYDWSCAYGVCGSQQVGFGRVGGMEGSDHALLWSGAAGSAVDLAPAGVAYSYAVGTDGAEQVGYGYPNAQDVGNGLCHALLWSGTAASAVDLNPSGFINSTAYEVSGSQEVGYGMDSATGNSDHALLWTGTANSVVDLTPNPPGTEEVGALATNGTQQVGYIGGAATLWSGTAASLVYLGQFASADGFAGSAAFSIDGSGNVFGDAAGYGNTSKYAVEWSPATTLTWNNVGGTGDGHTWDTYVNQNWDSSAAAAFFHAGDNITFNDSNTGNYAVTLNTTVSPGSVTFNNSLGNYTITGSGTIADAGAFVKSGSDTITIGTALSVGSMSITGGTLTLASNTTLGSGVATSNVNLTSLSITGNGVLDVNNNHIIITYGSSDPISAIAAYIASGFNNGGWNGPGIISSAAQTPTNGLAYGVGYADGADGVVSGLSSGQIEVMYTLLGDANLDGVVNAADFTILAANFNQPVTSWDQGDFNYDGLVNAADFTDLAANFNQSDSGAAVSAGDVAALDAFAAANGLLADVPEPGSGAIVAAASIGFLAARRARRRRME